MENPGLISPGRTDDHDHPPKLLDDSRSSWHQVGSCDPCTSWQVTRFRVHGLGRLMVNRTCSAPEVSQCDMGQWAKSVPSIVSSIGPWGGVMTCLGGFQFACYPTLLICMYIVLGRMLRKVLVPSLVKSVPYRITTLFCSVCRAHLHVLTRCRVSLRRRPKPCRFIPHEGLNSTASLATDIVFSYFKLGIDN